MRKSHVLILAAIAALPVAATPALAEEAAATAPAPDYTLTANVNLASQYRFRGLEQTWGQPALQGGADYVHSSGFYLGTWASNVSGNTYAGGNLEVDYYGGYNGKINDDLGWTVGGYGYAYPGANNNKQATPGAASQKYDNFEINGGANWKWLSYKLSYATTDYFGANTNTGYTAGTKGTTYQDLSANYPITDDLTLNAHVGHTHYKANYLVGGVAMNPSYTDYKLGITKTFKDGWNVSAAYIKASNDGVYKNTQGLSRTAADLRDVNKATLVVTAGRTF